ncbi:MAG: MBL fold metallo-hydrolase [Burkholderiales bacterium]
MPKRYHLKRPDLAQAVAVELRICKDVKSQQRLLAARLAASGQLTAAQIAEQLGISRRRFFDWMNALKAAGLGVEDIDFVMCSHLHGDHVGWNTRMENGRWVPTFPKARYLFSKKEYAYWSEIHQKTPLNQIADSVLPIIEANRAELVTSDHELNDHIRLAPTPGHTPDHFAVCAGKGGDKAVFTGDLIHSPMQARYPELVMRVDTDRDQGVRTRRAFFEPYCDTDTLCCTMHFPSPSVGYIKRWDNGFKLEYLD